jgi:Mobilization protein NikA
MHSKNHTEYQKQYRKHRIHRLIIFSREEYQTLLNSAKEHHKPFSTFIREMALAHISNQYVLPNDEQTKAVQLLLTRYGTNLNQLAYISNATFHIDDDRIAVIQNQFQKLKQEIIDLYNKPISVEEVIRDAFRRDPEFKKRIAIILNESS